VLAPHEEFYMLVYYDLTANYYVRRNQYVGKTEEFLVGLQVK
jgi:hypothetical protein